MCCRPGSGFGAATHSRGPAPIWLGSAGSRRRQHQRRIRSQTATHGPRRHPEGRSVYAEDYGRHHQSHVNTRLHGARTPGNNNHGTDKSTRGPGNAAPHRPNLVDADPSWPKSGQLMRCATNSGPDSSHCGWARRRWDGLYPIWVRVGQVWAGVDQIQVGVEIWVALDRIRAGCGQIESKCHQTWAVLGRSSCGFGQIWSAGSSTCLLRPSGARAASVFRNAVPQDAPRARIQTNIGATGAPGDPSDRPVETPGDARLFPS